MHLASFAGRDTPYDFRAILKHLLGMESAFFARKALYNYARVGIYQNRHAANVPKKRLRKPLPERKKGACFYKPPSDEKDYLF
uniref:Uncharacterized protein n=1 Tax=uncultured Bacteroidota bacterium TaxID=152509 RepID=H5SMR5_9BACT|nr:hypothetical protein HGMM_F50F04C14 [uncultured Bacteroidetes bacterium]